MTTSDATSTASSRHFSHSAAFLAPVPALETHCFAIRADASPGMMSRVLELFAKRNLVPTRWHSDVITAPARDGGDTHLQIDIQMEGMEAELAAYVARCLRQIYGVESVLTSAKVAG
jgi:hypothetical protein